MSRFGKDTKAIRFDDEYTVKSVMGGTHHVVCDILYNIDKSV